MLEDGRGLVDNIGGALRILLALATPFARGRRLRWGVTDTEWSQEFPGDALVPAPRWQYLHGITVKAPPAAVWPWVAQIGQGRGGFYSYERLENLVGCRIRNAEDIVPALQAVAVGDPIRLHPEMPPLAVTAVEPGRALVLFTRADIASGSGAGEGVDENAPTLSWAFVVAEAEGGSSRVFSRYRADYPAGWVASLSYGPWLVEPVSFAMDVRMLAGIRWRAERASGAA